MITVDNIVKEYNRKTILDHISLKIEQGQSIAFTGHNGCGKSTLLKIIAGLVQPTAGKVHYERPFLFHYVPEHFPKMHLTAEQYLFSQGKMDGLEDAEVKERIQSLSEDFFFHSMLKTPMKHLSKGSLQKVGVIQALLKTPEALLLDEPLSGQDTASQQVFIDKINALRKQGVVILMSCHEPYLIDAITDCVYCLDGGILTAVKKKDVDKQWYVLYFEQGQQSVVPEQWKGHLVVNSFSIMGLFLFCIMVWIGVTIQEVEPEVSEQVMILRLNSERKYYFSHILFLICICAVLSGMSVMIPVVNHSLRGGTLFDRNIILSDLVGGFLIMFICAFVGGMVGELFHGRIIRNRSMGIGLTFFATMLVVCRNGVIAKYAFTKYILWVIPPVSDVVSRFTNEAYYDMGKLLGGFALLLVYGIVLAVVKVELLRKMKF